MQNNQPFTYVKNIEESGLSIYDSVEIGDPSLWIPTPELELILDKSLKGISLRGLPIRTRSKVVKEKICTSLGYPVPKSFKKSQPRFPGQNFDTYVQKSRNLQIWNEDLSPNRRYVLIQVSTENKIVKVKVVAGDELSKLDTTGTLTQKYQARLKVGQVSVELVSDADTENILPIVADFQEIRGESSPVDNPRMNDLMPIKLIFEKIKSLVNTKFSDLGYDQERNRGAALHRAVCEALGYNEYKDNGRFPDIRHQLLEVKLQTSPTIDLGLVSPDSELPLDISQMEQNQIKHSDVRYAIFYGTTDGETVHITHLFLTTGRDFFSRFVQFQGKVLNKKIQIPLPLSFFET